MWYFTQEFVYIQHKNSGKSSTHIFVLILHKNIR